MLEYGLQLYSLRDYSDDDFFKTIRKAAEMGYKSVEYAGYYGKSADEIKALAEQLGITSISAHVGIDTLKNDLEREIEFSKQLGLKYIICPWSQLDTHDSCLAHAELFNKVGEKCKENGIIFGYHNHAHEFVDDGGQPLLDTLFDNTDPQLVVAQFDVYWVKRGGFDPVDYIKKYSGRIPIIHLKELAENTDNVTIGTGTLDFKAIIEAAKANGCVDFIIEQEHSSEDRMLSAANSLKYLKGLNL